MRSRWPASIVVGAIALSITGCPDDPGGDPDTGRRDTGTCRAVDVGPSAPDGNEPEAGADADAGPDTNDASADTIADADGDAATDVSLDVTVDAATDSLDATGDATIDTATDASSDVTGDATGDATSDGGDTSFETIASEFDAGKPVPRSAVDQIINLSCTFTSCHGRSTGAGGLVLYKTGFGDWYPNLVNVVSEENPSMPYVDPGNPAGSWLAHKIVGDQCMYTAQCKSKDCGDQMPAANEPLDDSDIQTILDWIRQGAKPK
jgi:hypothetical protein